MSKVAIVSFFKSNNFGDLLIGKNLIEMFSPKCQCDFFDTAFNKIDPQQFQQECSQKKQVDLSQSKPSFRQKLLRIPLFGELLELMRSATVKKPQKATEVFKDYDTVIFAGGNVLMDLKKLPIQTTLDYRIIKALKKQNKKVNYLFCGIGPFRSKPSKRKAKKILEKADYISVRDKFSKEVVQKLLPDKKVDVWYDPVLISTAQKLPCKNTDAIGVNVYFGDGKIKRETVKKAFVDFLSELTKCLPNKKFILFSSELADYKDVNDIKECFKEQNNVVVENVDSCETLFGLYKEIDFLLGVRMHTIITSLISGIPSVTVAWQGKVESLVQRFNNERYSASVEDFVSNPSQLVQKMLQGLENKQEIINSNEQILKGIKEETLEKFNEYFLGE